MTAELVEVYLNNLDAAVIKIVSDCALGTVVAGRYVDGILLYALEGDASFRLKLLIRISYRVLTFPEYGPSHG